MEQVEVEIEQEDGQGDPNPGLDLEQGNEDIEEVTGKGGGRLCWLDVTL